MDGGLNSQSAIFFATVSVLLFSYFGIWIDMAYPVFIMVILYLSFTLYKYTIEWKRRIVFENELGIAKQIQESFLPKSMPVSAQMDIAARMLTAKAVGGDLYDFVESKDGRIGMVPGGSGTSQYR